MVKFKAVFAILYTLFFVQASINAQVYDPVKWQFDVEEISDTEAEISFTAIIEDGWHIYATELSSDEGPLPTEFMFDISEDYKTVGKIQQGKFKTEYDKNFRMDLDYFEGKPVFKQKIERISGKDFKVRGELSFMVCDDEKCLPPEYVPFELAVKGKVEESKSENPFGNISPGISPLGGGIATDPDSQIYDPISWRFFIENETDSTAILVAEATLEPNWHVYSMYLEHDNGPIPTGFVFENLEEGYELIGKATEGEP